MSLSAIHLNWLSVVVAVGACFALGGIWFPLIVNKAYVAALGREQRTGALSLVGPLICLSVTTIATAILIGLLGIDTYLGAVEFGAFIVIGYQTPMVVNIALNPLFPRPFLYSLINAPYFIAGSILVSLIVVAMK